MQINAIQDLLPADILAFMLVFSRVGAMTMALPALGEATIPARARLMLALGLTLVLVPLVGNLYPPSVRSMPAMLAGMVISEVLIGLIIGLLLRIVMGSVQVAGNVIATQTGLAFAQGLDPTQGAQGAIISLFLSLLAVTLIFMVETDSARITKPARMFNGVTRKKTCSWGIMRATTPAPP